MFAYSRAFRIPGPKSTGGGVREMICDRALGGGRGESGVVVTGLVRVKAWGAGRCVGSGGAGQGGD